MTSPQAVIDIGSSAVKYGIYDFDGSSPHLVHEGDPVATSLGRGMSHGDALPVEARARTLEVVQDFVRDIQSRGAGLRLVCATEAVRRASDRESFLADVRALAGVDAEICCISAEEEVSWGLLSARATLSLDEATPRLFIDPGGSSNDVAVTGPAPMRWTSVPFGMNDLLHCVPVRENDAVMTPKRLADLRAFLLEKYLLVREFAGTTAVQDLVGTSGAALSLGAVAAGVGQDSRLARIREAHGEKLNRAAVARMIEESAPLSAAERRTVWPCLSPTRSIIFVHGALIYEALLEVLNLESFTVNAYGMKLGGLLARRLATDE